MDFEKLKSSHGNVNGGTAAPPRVLRGLETPPDKMFSVRKPESLDEFIGQKRAVNQLRKYAKVAFGGTLYPIMITGPSGNGKTQLATSYAKEIGYNFVHLHIHESFTANDLCYLLDTTPQNTIYLLDESQSMSKELVEFLFMVLDKGEYYTPGEKKVDIDMPMKSLGRKSFLFATNYPGKTRKELRNRVRVIDLDPYAEREMLEMARFYIDDQFSIDEETLLRLVNSSQGVPRELIKVLEDVSILNGCPAMIELDHVLEIFKDRNITEHGFNSIQAKYLSYLVSQPEYNAKISSIATFIGVDHRYLRENFEPHLLHNGLIKIGANSQRHLTRKGKDIGRDVLFNQNRSKK